MAESDNPVLGNHPHPGLSITQDTPTKSYREPYIRGVEFDTGEETWDELVEAYPDAWEEYYNEPLPNTYKVENVVALQEAVRFWQYMNVGETILPQKEALQNTYGAENAVYAPESAESAAYENPEAFSSPIYDEAVYEGVSAGNPLPTVTLGGDRVIGEDYFGLFTEEYRGITEYKATQRVPSTPYEWGGPYAIGKYKIKRDDD